MPHTQRSRTHRLLLVVTSTLLAAAVPVGLPPAYADDGVSPGDTVVGQLVRAWPEHANPAAEKDEGPVTFIKKDDGGSVRVPTSDVQHVPVGATVAVTLGGQVVDKATTQDGLDPAHDVVAAQVVSTAPAPTTAPATAPVTDQVTVVVAVPRGGTADGTTVDQVVNLVNGPVHDFWATQSDGAIQLGATGVAGVLPLSVDCSDPFALWSEAATFAGGWTQGTGKHLLVYLPRNSLGCAYGLAVIGSSLTSGGELYVTDTVTSVVAHELGHNFGLGHSSEIQCDGSVDGGSCSTTSYRDYYDVMGASWSQVGSLNVVQAARLGFLPGSAQQAVTPTPGTTTTVTLAPVSGRSGIRATEVTAPNGTVYWLEYRPPSGQDAWLGTSLDWTGLKPGVLVRKVGPGPTSDTSLLFDASPSRAGNWAYDSDQPMPLGREISLAGGFLRLTVTSQTSTAATVSIALVSGDPACVTRSSAFMAGVALLTAGGATNAFAVGLDRALWYRPIDGSPTSWHSLGGGVLYGPAAVAAGSTSFAFVVGLNGALFYRADSGSGWGPWTTLGGFLTASPAAASLGNGEVRVFGRGLDGQLWSREFSGGSWSDWIPGGGYLTSPPTATVNADGVHIDVLVRGTDGLVYAQSLAQGVRTAAYQRRDIAACSAVALGAAQAATDAGTGAFVDSRGIPKLLQTSGLLSLSGALTSAPAVQFSGSGFVLVGRGLDNALWLYDARSGGSGWRSLGGYLL